LEKPFDSMGVPPLRHGIILEDMSGRCYSQRLGDITIYNFGMIPHPTIDCFGASPDGINALGVMVEIKTPYRRRVDGNVPFEYMLQMQGQMAVCGLRECDFVDADIKFNYRTIDEYLTEVGAVSCVDHGIIVEYMDHSATPPNMFDYSPEYMSAAKCVKWGNETRIKRNTTMPMLPWKLRKLIIKRVVFDEEVWEDLVPKVTGFWEEVLSTRAAGASALPAAKVKIVRKKPEMATAVIAMQSFAFVPSDSDDD